MKQIILFFCFTGIVFLVSGSAQVEPTLSHRLVEVNELRLKEISRMMDGGSKCWRFDRGDKKSLWIVTETGALQDGPPWNVKVYFAKGMRDDLIEGYTLKLVGDDQQRILSLLSKHKEKLVISGSTDEARIKRIEMLMAFIRDPSQPILNFILDKRLGRFSENYPD